MRKLIVMSGLAALLLVPLGVSATAPAKPTTTTAAPTTTTAPQPTGVTGWEVVFAETGLFDPGTFNQAEAVCPAGKVVTGGGYILHSPPYSENMKVTHSRPLYNGATYSWLVIAKNANDVAYSFGAYAICVDGA